MRQPRLWLAATAAVLLCVAGGQSGVAAQTAPTATPAGAAVVPRPNLATQATVLERAALQATATPVVGAAVPLTPGVLGRSDLLASAAVRERLAAESQPRVELVNPRIVRRGAWAVAADTAAGRELQRSNTPNTALEFTFRGPSVTWLYRGGPDGGIARVFVDGQLRGTVDQFVAAPPFEREATFEAAGAGPHTLRVEVTGARQPQATNSFVTVEAFVTPMLVAASAVPLPGPQPTPPAGPPGVVVSRPLALTVGPPSAPQFPRDERYFAETAFRIDHTPFWDYFRARGQVKTFGFPSSRTVMFLGCTTQFFQRQLMQQCTGQPVQTMNLLDPGLMPYNQINKSTFPEHNPDLAKKAPEHTAPNYGRDVLDHLRASSPDSFENLPVRFFETYMTTVPGSGTEVYRALTNLEIWGFPTSPPQFDPLNRNFVYQRFQRGIMHYDRTKPAAEATQGILLADWFKTIIVGDPALLPDDLEAQVQNANSRFYTQYCPALAQWVCQPARLDSTVLLFGFEGG